MVTHIADKTKRVHAPIGQKAKVIALMELGLSNKEIADKLDMSLNNIQDMRWDLKDTKESELVAEAIQISPNTVKTLVDKARESKKHTPTVVKQLEHLEHQLGGIHKLDEKFQSTMTKILEKVDVMLQKEDLKTSDLVAMTNAVANAYSQVFNSKAVNVNVNNGQQISGSGLSMFKNSLRG